MKKQVYTIAAAFVLTVISATAIAQSKVKDGSVSGSSLLPNGNAVLEIESNQKGILFPRVPLTATNSASPMSAFTAGMVVYNTATAGTAPYDVVPGFYYCDGTKWLRMTGTTSTNSLSSSGGSIISNVDGVSASLTPVTGSIVSAVGFDSSGKFATESHNTVSNGTDWVQVGTTLLQGGTSTNTASSATKTVNFTKPFTTTPSVNCTYVGAANVSILVTSATTSSFSWKSVNAATGADVFSCNINWQAMGK